MKKSIIRLLVAVILSSTTSTTSAASMTFTVEGKVIRASGALNEGDTRLFFDGLGSDIRSDINSSYVIYLDSVGGSLLEGVLLGKELRERRIVSHVSGGSRCLSACAFAFLGGTFQYAVASGPMREIEWGAELGFHGFSANSDKVVAVNEALSMSRAVNAILVEYTQKMGGVDYAWIADALTTAPEEMTLVNSPRDLSSLSIALLGGPDVPPSDWDANICMLMLRDILQNEDEPLEYRLRESSTLFSVKEIIELIVSPVMSANNLASDKIDGEQALNFIVGNGFRLDHYRPILDARYLPLERGYGLYFDYCVTFRSADTTFGILVDSLGGGIRHINVSRRSPNRLENKDFRLFSWDQPLWSKP